MNTRQTGPGWNSDKAVGQRQPFTDDELGWLCHYHAKMGNWHDLCLISSATDSMLRAGDLLGLRVGDVTYPDGRVRERLARKQQKTKHNVFPALTPNTQARVAQWVLTSGKQPHHFLFTRSKAVDAAAIGRGQDAKQVKRWAEWAGQFGGEYSTHSIRRTKPRIMYVAGEDIALISRLLGHKSIGVTLDYLGIEQDAADAATLRYDLIGRSRLRKPAEVT